MRCVRSRWIIISVLVACLVYICIRIIWLKSNLNNGTEIRRIQHHTPPGEPDRTNRHNHGESNNLPQQPRHIYSSYAEALKSVASRDNVVVLSIVDEGYVPMAINFYLTCIQPHDIQNALMVAIHPGTCSKLAQYDINCFQYLNEINDTGVASLFRTRSFNRKVTLRTDFVAEALEAGFTVLSSDLDMLYIKNPFDYIVCNKATCDLAAMMDNAAGTYNSGFVYVHPSGLPLYRRMQKIAVRGQKMNDQEHMNLAVHHVKELKIKSLPISEYLAGQFFYDVGRHYADSMEPCPECVVVHNNWIASVEAKIYRAKELHHWMYDGDQYYTSKTRQYVTYTNEPSSSANHTMEMLKTGLALARILNRILILPKFYCGLEECGLHYFLKIRYFDRSFWDLYREYSFLTHKLVPEAIKTSIFNVTQTLRIGKQSAVENQFGDVTQAILKFTYLNTTITFSNPATKVQFDNLVKEGFVPGSRLNF